MNLSRRIRDLRYAKGWGPDELASRAKISRTALYQIERGERRRAWQMEGARPSKPCGQRSDWIALAKLKVGVCEALARPASRSLLVPVGLTPEAQSLAQVLSAAFPLGASNPEEDSD